MHLQFLDFKELPRVEDQLTELMNDYERTHGHVLFINGKDYRQLISEQWISYEESKENEKLQRVTICPVPLFFVWANRLYFEFLRYFPAKGSCR